MGQTDSITFTCTACGHTAEFPTTEAGKAIYCPKCQAAQVVRTGGTDRFAVERIPTGRIAKAEAQPSTDRIVRPHGMAGTARIDFTCGACNHSARISAALAGQPVRCPGCGTVQLAGVAALRVVRLDATGKLPFTCTACNYQARLNPDYAGKAIRCPKCQGAQVVPRVLREPSGAFQALPSGAAVVRSEPGTGSVRKPPAMPVAAPAPPAQSAPPAPRSEPSPALRTPAGGIVIHQPLKQPTPLPGSFATPPPGLLRTPLPVAAPVAPSSPPLEPIDVDGDDKVDLGDEPGRSDERPKGSVVRRSGRLRTPLPEAAAPLPPPDGAQPTLEPARAVQPEPDEPPPPRPPKPSPPAAAVPASSPSPATIRARSLNSKLLPVLGGAAGLLLIIAIVLAVLWSSASGREQSLAQQLDKSEERASTAEGALAETRRTLADSEAARKMAETKAADAEGRLQALTSEHDRLKAELDQLKAEQVRLKSELEDLRAKHPAEKPSPR